MVYVRKFGYGQKWLPGTIVALQVLLCSVKWSCVEKTPGSVRSRLAKQVVEKDSTDIPDIDM